MLFIVVNSFFVLPSILSSGQNLVAPVPRELSIKTSLPKTTTGFGEILAKEYSREEKTKIENVALNPAASLAVLGAQTASVTPTIDLAKLDKFDAVSTKEGQLTVAVLGDSMVDTLQKDLPQLKVLLTQAFPNFKFNLLNYGVGATNIEDGYNRLTNAYDYLGTHHPALVTTSPDIVVIESFAYNPWSNSASDLDRQWHTLTKILDTLKANLPKTKIVLAATIAPNSDIFGDGVLNWNPTDKRNKAATIRSYLQNIINFASSAKLPLADAYHASLDSNNEGDPHFINASDHLHPSGDGGYLFSQKIVDAIVKNKLIE